DLSEVADNLGQGKASPTSDLKTGAGAPKAKRKLAESTPPDAQSTPRAAEVPATQGPSLTGRLDLSDSPMEPPLSPARPVTPAEVAPTVGPVDELARRR